MPFLLDKLRRGKMVAKVGSQQPTAIVVIPYENTLGKEAIDLYEKSGRKAQEWQKDMVNHLMARNEDNLWTHTRWGYSLPRRNGKNEVVAIREMWGLEQGEQIAHTAHRTKTSRAAWERLLKLLDAAGIKYKSTRAIGMESITLPATGGRVEFRTRSAKGGLGEGFDLLVIDEAQEYTDDQESALKYVVSDSKNPQTIMCGTPPTPVSSGTVFTKFRRDTLQGLKPNAGWESWEVESLKPQLERDWWYLTNPSLGAVLTERAILDEVGDDEIDFNIQRLGLWLKYNQKSAISKAEWEELKSKTMPKLEGKLSVGIKYGHDGTNVAMAIAVKTKKGKHFVECIDIRPRRAGNEWIINFLEKADIGVIVIDGQSGQKLLADELEALKIKPKAILPTVKEVVNANNIFEQELTNKEITHRNQPALTQSVSNCEKRQIGSGGGFGYKSLHDSVDIALMESVILANWGLGELKAVRKQRIGY